MNYVIWLGAYQVQNFLFAAFLSGFFSLSSGFASYSRFRFWNHSVLIFNILTDEVKHVFIHLSIIQISAFCIVSIQVFAHLLYWWSALFLLICRSCFYGFYMSPLSVICIANIFSCSATYLFILLMVFWWKRKSWF